MGIPFHGIESVHLRRSRNAYELSEERRKEFRKLGAHVGTTSAPLENAQAKAFPSAGVMFSPSGFAQSTS
jgi:hypothetical protein